MLAILITLLWGNERGVGVEDSVKLIFRMQIGVTLSLVELHNVKKLTRYINFMIGRVVQF